MAPPRAERARLESLLADVWSRDRLPFPGISNRHGSGHLVRASSMMRKLSIASLAESLNKRSGSLSRRAARLSEDGLGGSCQHLDSIDSEPDPIPKTLHGDNSDATTVTPGSWNQETMLPPVQNEPVDEKSDGEPHMVQKLEARDKQKALSRADTVQDDASTTSVLRKSSANSIRLAASKVPGKAAENALEKENACEVQEYKSLSRWARVGNMAKGEGKGHGLRSFFR